MPIHTSSTASISDEMDTTQCNILEQRFLSINEQRLQRTQLALSHRQQIFLNLLPLLFHTNHPMLPGYVSQQTPFGISAWFIKECDIKLAKKVARSFQPPDSVLQPSQEYADIYALFLMGSAGTIAHSKSSDLDIWVCHRSELKTNQIAELEKKCTRLSSWAQTLGLDVHFFLMNNEQFHRGEATTFDNEASGSAQHYLLLDEFYRTALLLAGRFPLWWYNPANRELDYENYTRILLKKRFISENKIIDFGGIANIPDGEFIGAGIWQLYKGIESPYKSVLKLLLLECYASEYPTFVPLSLSYKEKVYSGHYRINDLDPYVMVYRRLEKYLLDRNELKRLELLRRCFYFKVNKPLTRPITGARKSWQRALMEQLTQEWGWSHNYLHSLDSRSEWKSQQVLAERKLLVNELTNSYRFLIDFARQIQADSVITADEFNILGRKLHAAFERRAGKIDFINTNISNDLSETELGIVFEKKNALKSSAWSVHSLNIKAGAVTCHQILHQTRELIELLVWCHCNGLITPQTHCRLFTKSTSITHSLLQNLLQCLQQWLPLPIPLASHESFQAQARNRSVMLLINVNISKKSNSNQQSSSLFPNPISSLHIDHEQQNLICTIDMITFNSWNEVSTHHFEDHALLNCLLTYLRMSPPGLESALPILTIRSFNSNHAIAIGQRTEELFRDIAACYYSGAQSSSTRYVFEFSNEYYCLQFRDHQPHISHLHDEEGLVEHLGQPQSHYSPLRIDRNALHGHPLNQIAEYSNHSAIQIFYLHTQEKKVDVYIVDEKGSIVRLQVSHFDDNTLLRPLHRFIRAIIDRQNTESNDLQQGFGIYPVEFFELKAENRQITHCERRTVNTDLSKLFFFNIQVIVRKKISTNEMNYTLYCDQQEFTEMEFGNNLFKAVAHYILSCRHSCERYPCYITDLDLSECKTNLAPRGNLQLSHYLRIKTQIETYINEAMYNLQ